MTCSYQDSMTHQSSYELEKAQAECSNRANCTAVRTNKCTLFTSSTEFHYDFCNDDPIPSELPWIKTTGLFGLSTTYEPAVCVYKKPDGTFIFVVRYFDMGIFLG